MVCSQDVVTRSVYILHVESTPIHHIFHRSTYILKMWGIVSFEMNIGARTIPILKCPVSELSLLKQEQAESEI